MLVVASACDRDVPPEPKPVAPVVAAVPVDAAPVAPPAPPEPPPAKKLAVALEVKLESKRKDSSVDDYRERVAGLLSDDLEVAPATGAAGTVVWRFRERDGARLTSDPFGGSAGTVGRRTVVSATVEIRDPAGKTVARLDFPGENSALYLHDRETLYEASVRDAFGAYHIVPRLAAVALGDTTRVNALADATLTRSLAADVKPALALLEKHQAHLDARGAASFCVARRRFAECAAMGEPAVGPLYQLLDSGWGLSLGVFGYSPTGARREATRAFLAIPATDAFRIRNLVGGSRSDNAVARMWLDEVARSGRPDARELLTEWSADPDATLASAAKRALQALK